MGCAALSKGRGIDCSKGLGGVKTVYLVNFEEVFNFTVVDRLVTSLFVGDGVVPRGDIYQVDLPRRGGSVVEVINADVNSPTKAVYYSQGLTINLDKLDTCTQEMLKELGKAKLMAFVVLNQLRPSYTVPSIMVNQVVLLGEKNGLRLNSGSGTSGDNWSAHNGYEWILTGEEKKPMPMMYPIDSEYYDYFSIIDTCITP
jgi:hypothetical protein